MAQAGVGARAGASRLHWRRSTVRPTAPLVAWTSLQLKSAGTIASAKFGGFLTNFKKNINF